MELDLIWCHFLSKHKLWPICTGTCVRTYFCQLIVGLKNVQHYVLFYQAPCRKFPEPEPPHNRPAQKPWLRIHNSSEFVTMQKRDRTHPVTPQVLAVKFSYGPPPMLNSQNLLKTLNNLQPKRYKKNVKRCNALFKIWWGTCRATSRSVHVFRWCTQWPLGVSV